MTAPRDDDWEDVPDAADLPDEVANGEIVEPPDGDAVAHAVGEATEPALDDTGAEITDPDETDLGLADPQED